MNTIAYFKMIVSETFVVLCTCSYS